MLSHRQRKLGRIDLLLHRIVIAMRASDLRVGLWKRARMEPRPQKLRDRFAMAAKMHGPQRRREIGAIELPVLLQFPREEAKNAGNQPDQPRRGAIRSRQLKPEEIG